MLRALAAAGVLLLLGSCHAGPDPRRRLGRWVNHRDSVEFLSDGRVRLYTPLGWAEGTYASVGWSHIRVQIDGHRRSGETRSYYALARDGRLSLCEFRNYRHCMQFHRPGRSVRFTPR